MLLRSIRRYVVAYNAHIANYTGVVSGLRPGQYSSLTAPNLQPTANQERNDQCGNQHHSRELLMMGIVMPEHVEPIRSTIK